MTVTNKLESTYTYLDYQSQGPMQFAVMAAKDRLDCWASVYANDLPNDPPGAPLQPVLSKPHATAAVSSSLRLPIVLPNLTHPRWTLNDSSAVWQEQAASQWVWQVSKDMGTLRNKDVCSYYALFYVCIHVDRIRPLPW